MMPPGFDGLRAGREGCPSDVTLARLHAGELGSERAAELHGHVDGCAACTKQLATLDAGFAAHPQLDERRLLANIRTEADRRPRRGGLVRWLRLSLAPIALAAAVVAIVVRLPDERSVVVDEAPADIVRQKGGGAVLHVYRLESGVGRQTFSGDRFRAGDRLRFTVDLQRDQGIALYDADPAGTFARVFPSEGALDRIPAGPGRELPLALELDAALGNETLWLVACPTDVADAACTPGAKGAPPTCAPGCTVDAFLLAKE